MGRRLRTKGEKGKAKDKGKRKEERGKKQRKLLVLFFLVSGTRPVFPFFL
jgi:hypothetical protein